MITIPNILTFLRILIIPFYSFFLIKKEFKWALLLFIISAISDILDGHLARKLNQVSNLGKILDPISDKIIILISIIYFAIKNYLPPFLVIILFLKEILMLIFGLFFLIKKIEIVSSRVYGKLATTFISISVIMILLNIPYGDVIFFIGFIFSISAGLDYLFIYIKKFKFS